ncbi:hypothetical protein ACEN88_24590, partial [Massilia sp. CT11-108]|uniref:hypothetical protein n=1 Tax=Massilia sp. CT11-108 TaxID=3393900 RepID=UPI0039A410F2
MDTNERQQTVAVLGAGPVGLAAAAHLVARGLVHVVPPWREQAHMPIGREVRARRRARFEHQRRQARTSRPIG